MSPARSARGSRGVPRPHPRLTGGGGSPRGSAPPSAPLSPPFMSRRCVLSSSAQAASQRDGPPRPRHSPSASPYGWDSLPLVVGGLGRCCLAPQPVGVRYRSLLERPRAPGVMPSAPPRALGTPPFAGWPDSSPAGGFRSEPVLEPPSHRPQTSPPEVRLGILVTVAAHDHFALWGRCCGSLRSVQTSTRRHGLADSARAPHGSSFGFPPRTLGSHLGSRECPRVGVLHKTPTLKNVQGSGCCTKPRPSRMSKGRGVAQNPDPQDPWPSPARKARLERT